MISDRQLNSAAISAQWARRRERARKTGVCMGQPGQECFRSVKVGQHCFICAAKERIRSRTASSRSYYLDKAEGRCVRCGQRLEGADLVFVSCSDCRRKVNERRHRSEPYIQKGLVR